MVEEMVEQLPVKVRLHLHRPLLISDLQPDVMIVAVGGGGLLCGLMEGLKRVRLVGRFGADSYRLIGLMFEYWRWRLTEQMHLMLQ